MRAARESLPQRLCSLQQANYPNMNLLRSMELKRLSGFALQGLDAMGVTS
jgi:hypothetical protein